MKRAIIVHCWSGYPEYCWYQQTKKELEGAGCRVEVPAMPETDAPKLSLWLPKLQEIIGVPDEDLFLVGHSIGAVAVMRYLETMALGQRVGGVVLVAGFTDPLGFKELENFFQTPLDFAKIKSAAKHFSLIHSDDDPYVPLRYGDILKDALDAKRIVQHAMGHFSGPVDDTKNCISLPIVTEEILKMV